MNVTEVVTPSAEGQQWDRGERLARTSVSLGWIRKHFGDITWKAAQKVRASWRPTK